MINGAKEMLSGHFKIWLSDSHRKRKKTKISSKQKSLKLAKF